MRRLYIIVSASVVVLLAGYLVYHGYQAGKNRHLMSLAHQLLAKSDTRGATISVQAVLRSDPKNLDATRVMAQLADASRLPTALLWRSRVVELNPHSLEDRLALAKTALSVRDYMSATNALEGADAISKGTAAYHNMAGAVAAAANRQADAAMHFLEASRIDPQNLAPQLSLAVVRIHGTNTLDQEEARNALKRLVANPTNSTLRCQALRELTLDAMGQKHEDAGLALSGQLVQETNSVFTDWIMRLEVLLVTKNAEFKSTLARCQLEAATNESKIYELATWEMTKSSPKEALAWLRSLPANIQTNQPVTLLVTECYNTSKDWRGLQAWLEKQRWAEAEFIRHAFMCRALRGEELAETAKTEWGQALKAADSNEQSIVMLLRLAAKWNWITEVDDLLWTIVNRYPQEKWAEQALAQALFAGGQTRSLMQLFKVGSSRVDLQACKLEYSIVSPK